MNSAFPNETAPHVTRPKLLDRVRIRLRTRHASPRTVDAYIGWIRRFILFHRKRHPSEMGPADVAAFLSHLAVEEHVSASTQNQALRALLFLYREVLGQPLPRIEGVVAAKRPTRLPVVLTSDEVRALLSQMHGTIWLIASLLYGGGLRLSECLALRVKDLDFDRRQIVVRRGKGQKDRGSSPKTRFRAEAPAGFGDRTMRRRPQRYTNQPCCVCAAKICVPSHLPPH
jgi:integrase